MGLPVTQVIDVYRGDTKIQVFRWMTGTTGSSAAVNLTGYTGRLQIRDTLGTQAVEYTTPTTLVFGGTAGTMAFTGTPAQTAALTQCEYEYDLETTSPGGVVTTVFKGPVNVTGDITR